MEAISRDHHAAIEDVRAFSDHQMRSTGLSDRDLHQPFPQRQLFVIEIEIAAGDPEGATTGRVGAVQIRVN
jgi:hypothetical protein